MDERLHVKKRKVIYAYRGGGSLGSPQQLASSITVVCKDWGAASYVHVGLWLLASCSPFTPEVWPDATVTFGNELHDADPLVLSDSDSDDSD